MTRYNKAWGPAAFAERFDLAWGGFTQALESWLRLIEGHGPDAVAKAFRETLKGGGRPEEGQILSTRPSAI